MNASSAFDPIRPARRYCDAWRLSVAWQVVLIALGSLTLGCGGLGATGGTSRNVPVEELPTVLWFEDYSTVLSGTFARSYYLFPRAFDLSDSEGAIRCTGPAPLIEVPVDASPPLICDGMSGVAQVRCSDGRMIGFEWIVDPDCRTGYGQGQDQDGHPVYLLLGGSQALASTVLEEATRSQSSKPPLPIVGTALEGGVGTGTAFFVSTRGHLVTNHHVVMGGKKIFVSLDDGDLVPAKLLREDAENDLALLQVDAIRTPLGIMGPGTIERGLEVAALGYPLIPLQGREQKATIGHVNALSGPLGDERFAQIDAPIQPGNSGGPVLNRKGEVVGVVTMMLSTQATLDAAGVVPQNVNYAIKTNLVHRFLERAGASVPVAAASGADMDWTELLSQVEDSVVLVVVER